MFYTSPKRLSEWLKIFDSNSHIKIAKLKNVLWFRCILQYFFFAESIQNKVDDPWLLCSMKKEHCQSTFLPRIACKYYMKPCNSSIFQNLLWTWTDLTIILWCGCVSIFSAGIISLRLSWSNFAKHYYARKWEKTKTSNS